MMAVNTAGENFKKSLLLTDGENRKVQNMVGTHCQALSTCVVQLFETEPPDHDRWVKRDAGILCLIKDNQERSYFLRLFCLTRKAVVWQQEIFKSFEIHTPKPFLHVFDGQDCVYAINYASEDEAMATLDIITKKLEKSRQKEGKKSSGAERPSSSTSEEAATDKKVEVSNEEQESTSKQTDDKEGEEPAVSEGDEQPTAETEAPPTAETETPPTSEAEAPPSAEEKGEQEEKETGGEEEVEEGASKEGEEVEGDMDKKEDGRSPVKTASLSSQSSVKPGPLTPEPAEEEGEPVPEGGAGVQDTSQDSVKLEPADDLEDITADLEEKEQRVTQQQ